MSLGRIAGPARVPDPRRPARIMNVRMSEDMITDKSV